MMKLPIIIFASTLLFSELTLAQDKYSVEDFKAQLSEVTFAKIQRDSFNLENSRRLYLTAYKETHHSQLNDELFIYSLQKMSMLWATYQVMELNFEQDIKETKILSPGGLDGLCIMTKFLRKYKNNLDPKFEKLITDDFNRAVLYLPLYEQTLSTMSDPLSENLCHNLP